MLAEDRVVTSLNISYGFLTPENQKCARLLANFPGSFDETAAIVILNHTDITVSECLNTLKYRSLLNIDGNTDCYRFHQLVKEFFRSQGLTVEREQFSDHFAIYYVTLYCGAALPDIEAKHHLEGFQILDLERCNFDYLFTMHVSIERHLDILMLCNVSDFDILSRVNTSEAQVRRLIALAKRQIEDKIKWQYLTKLNLIRYCQLLKTILMEYDVYFALVSNHTGNSASFEVYVNIPCSVRPMVKWMASHNDYKPCSQEARGLKNCIILLALI